MEFQCTADHNHLPKTDITEGQTFQADHNLFRFVVSAHSPDKNNSWSSSETMKDKTCELECKGKLACYGLKGTGQFAKITCD